MAKLPKLSNGDKVKIVRCLDNPKWDEPRKLWTTEMHELLNKIGIVTGKDRYFTLNVYGVEVDDGTKFYYRRRELVKVE